ncbi:YfdY family protein [[Enterobacter] lignolyticus]|uniref:Inner membrane protein n=2 Tax=[Enterobacter] lignolyticus TaxID=1334193 RepID=E3GA90_ENTLS|nr:YfdY family protein [[Enterobacter] lignolyticus]ADO47626.1 hypothetical protein Entcl_1361 [[Enterobacter] lignolyticus SCF1]ALR77558.1 hypothetical protein AO703_15030 [[Enterobacter] lignolyticus]
MIYLWVFLSISILSVSGYTGQVLGVASAVTSFIGMSVLVAFIYYFTTWLTGGAEMVTGLFLFLAPACGLIMRFMVGDGRR